MVYIALGSNIGDRAAALAKARALMTERGIRVVRASSIHETEPWGYADQGSFLNQVVEAETSLTPREVLETLLAIELEMGRVRTIKNGPRVIDLDILLIDGVTIREPDLEVPHPRMLERRFVLDPLAELLPDYGSSN